MPPIANALKYILENDVSFENSEPTDIDPWPQLLNQREPISNAIKEKDRTRKASKKRRVSYK